MPGQYASRGAPVSGLSAVNWQALSVGAVPVALVIPQLFVGGENLKSGVDEAIVYITSGVVNYLDNGALPTADANAGGAPFGLGAVGGSVIDIVGMWNIAHARFISQSGTATLVVLYYGF